MRSEVLYEMLIVQVNVPGDETQGDYYYRAFLPARALAALPGVYVINLTNEHRYRFSLMESADVLILNMLADADLIPIIQRRKRAGLLTIYEMNDDVCHHASPNPSKGFWDNAFNRRVLIRLLETVDVLQFSAEELKNRYARADAPSAVFPNQLGYVPAPRTPNKHRPLVLGWGGSVGHLEDLRAIAGPLIRWLESRNDVRWHVMGAPSVRDVFSALPDDRRAWTPPGSIIDYYQFLRGLDIGIAPMLDTPYNRCRSDVKYLEYAVHQVAPVVQRSQPYVSLVQHGKTGLFFDTPEELLLHLKRLVEDDAYRITLANAARAHVCQMRNPQRDAQQRIAFYRGLMQTSGYRTLAHPASQRFKSWAALEGGRRYGRSLILLPTAFEAALRAGLTCLRNARIQEARACFQEASHRAPESYLPDLFLASCDPQPLSLLRKCLAKNPDSLVAAAQLCKFLGGRCRQLNFEVWNAH